ncbi:MAG: nuclear transport factor 2 family protein [Desulfovibrionales bacterium]
MVRTTEEVFEDHLALAKKGRVEIDVGRNFDPECVLLTSDGIFQGHDGVRKAATALEKKLPQAVFTYTRTMVFGELAFLEWTGESEKTRVCSGADSFIVRNGRIRYMTAHYLVEEK